jgi:asparaginyl-tRNA synthetase
MEFETISNILNKSIEGRVSIRGWLHNKRSSGGINFLLIRDGTGIIQCTIRKDKVKPDVFELSEKLPLESTVEITGVSRKDDRAPYGFEISIEDLKVLHKAEENFPIGKKYHGPKFLLDNRHLWIRSRKMQNILRVKASVLSFARKWFEENGFTEFHSPIFTVSACEGGSTLFEVKYFDKKAYLTQSWQLYAEAAIASLGKIFTIAPSFRAEKSRTRRHLTEYWHLEAEMPFCNMEELMKVEENLVSYICQNVAIKNKKELEELGRDVNDLLKVKPPFPRITHAQAVEILKKDGLEVKPDSDFGVKEERMLTKHFDIPFFVTHFPKGIKAFYHKPDPNNPNVTLSVDMLAPEGYGEIIGSGQRIDDYDELMKRIKEENLNPEDYKWYLELRKWGSVEHSGFGLGVERFVMWICKLKHIRDAVAFPRLINRVYP